MLRFPVWLGDYCMPDEAGTFTAPMKFELLRCLDGFRQAICGTIRLTNIGHCTALIQPRYVGLLGASTGLFNWHNAAAEWTTIHVGKFSPPSMRPFFVWLLSEKQEGVQWREDIINNFTWNNDSHGHINRYLKLLPSTLKHLLLLSVCPPKLSGAIFLFPTIAMSSVSGCDGFFSIETSHLLILIWGSFPILTNAFQMGWNQHTTVVLYCSSLVVCRNYAKVPRIFSVLPVPWCCERAFGTVVGLGDLVPGARESQVMRLSTWMLPWVG